MKRFAVVLGALVVGILIGSARRSFGPGQDLCSGFTAARMLEDPELARQYFGALHGGDASAREQLDAMVGELRAAHGCGAAGDHASRDTFADPPFSPRLPPGHPPIDRAPPVFEKHPGSTLTI